MSSRPSLELTSGLEPRVHYCKHPNPYHCPSLIGTLSSGPRFPLLNVFPGKAPSLAKSNSPLPYLYAHGAKHGLWKQTHAYCSHFKSKTTNFSWALMLSGNCSPFLDSVLSSTLSHTFSLFSLPTPGLPPSPHPSYITENDVKPHAKTLCVLPSPACSWAHILHLPSHDQGWRVPCSWLRLGPLRAHKIIFPFICWKTTPHNSSFSLLYRQFLSLYWNFPDSTKTHCYFMYLKENPKALWTPPFPPTSAPFFCFLSGGNFLIFSYSFSITSCPCHRTSHRLLSPVAQFSSSLAWPLCTIWHNGPLPSSFLPWASSRPPSLVFPLPLWLFSPHLLLLHLLDP